MIGDIAIHGEVAYPMEEPDAEPAFGEIPGEPVPGSTITRRCSPRSTGHD